VNREVSITGYQRGHVQLAVMLRSNENYLHLFCTTLGTSAAVSCYGQTLMIDHAWLFDRHCISNYTFFAYVYVISKMITRCYRLQAWEWIWWLRPYAVYTQTLFVWQILPCLCKIPNATDLQTAIRVLSFNEPVYKLAEHTRCCCFSVRVSRTPCVIVAHPQRELMR